ncbi:uncharacterized protein LOC135950398 [Calliphora vicina]|uniref:uncharacterized protein LOC135950398 n=1 Tax=Calliphora vicina TaxID=7373 RepID=UPI00325B9CDF
MLIKFWLLVFLFAATTNAGSLSSTKLLNTLDCGQTSPCQGPPLCPGQSPCTGPSPAPTPPPAPVAPPPCTSCTPPPSCNNCPKPDCSMVPDGTTFPYANHCKLFYRCIGGSAVVSVCSNGFWYDRAISKCMLCDLVLNCEAKKD